MTFEEKLRTAAEMDGECGPNTGSVTLGVRADEALRRDEELRRLRSISATVDLLPSGPPKRPCWAMASQADLTCDGDSFEEAADALLLQLRQMLIERAEAFETKAEGERRRAGVWRMLATKVAASQATLG